MGQLILGRGGRLWLLAAAIVCAAFLSFTHPSPAHAARGFETGLVDGDLHSNDPATQTTAFNSAVQARAGFVLIYVSWSGVAPGTRPIDPTNPANYDWTDTDEAVRNATSRGLKVILAFVGAPAWAEGPGRPSTDQAPQGTWDPNPSDVGDFTRAIATRYSGVVRYWQLWAEPNLAVNLGPQFNGNTPVGFDVYRPMLNAFYDNLKAVSPQNMVMTGGTAPYGGLTPARGLTYQRMQPLTFWRGLLCLQTVKQKKKKKKGKGKKSAAFTRVPGCSPPRFDIAAHHPINVGAPTRHALNADDASTPDIGKVRRIIRAGVGDKPIWGTEIWWNSNPPSRGVSLKTQARYLSQSFYILWKQKVPVAIWFEIRDLEQNGRDPIPTCGLFFRDGRPKPAFQAFRFPFAAERLSKTRVRVWGMAPQGGAVAIGTGKGKHFHRIRTLKAGGNRVFVGKIRLRGTARLKAQQGSESSLIWRQS